MNSLSNQTTHMKAIGHPRRPLSGSKRRKASRQQTNNIKIGKTRIPFEINPIQAENTMAGTSTYAQFKQASGQGGSSQKEVNLTLVDFTDIDPSDGEWTVMHYDPSTLPGVINGAPQGTRLRHCRVSLLQGPINTTSHTQLNVGVLSGVLVRDGAWLGGDYTLASAKQTIILPSSTPRWVTVFDTSFTKLADQGLVPAQRTGQSEVFRLSLIDPDNGDALATEFTMQAKVELSYSTSFPLETTANYIQGTSPSPLEPSATGGVINGPVYPRVTGVSNMI